MVRDEPLLLRNKIMGWKSMWSLSKLHHRFSWSSLYFLSSSYDWLDLHLFFAFILVPPMWTFLNVYLLCWIHSRFQHDSKRGASKTGRQWSQSKGRAQTCGRTLMLNYQENRTSFGPLNPSLPFMLAFFNRIVRAGKILGRGKPGQCQFPCLEKCRDFLSQLSFVQRNVYRSENPTRGGSVIKKIQTHQID